MNPSQVVKADVDNVESVHVANVAVDLANDLFRG
jgi:hypothetical protein